MRCVKSGRLCEGYHIPTRKRSPEDPLTIIAYVPKPVQPHPEASPQELRALSFFQTKTANQLKGPFTDEIWSRLILQYAHGEPAIRHAIIALGSIHELYINGLDGYDDLIDQFATKHYQKSIQEICKLNEAPSDSRAINVALTTCVLFTGYESLRGHYLSAIAHANSGMKILAAYRNTFQGMCLSPDHLDDLYIQLDTHMLMMGAYGLTDTRAPRKLPEICVPHAFSTVNEAKDSLEDYINILFHETMGLTETLLKEQNSGKQVEILKTSHRVLTRQCQKWSDAFDGFLDNNEISNLTNDDAAGVLLLEAYRTMLRVVHERDPTDIETKFDHYEDEYRIVLANVEEFIERTATFVFPLTAQTGAPLQQVRHQRLPRKELAKELKLTQDQNDQMIQYAKNIVYFRREQMDNPSWKFEEKDHDPTMPQTMIQPTFSIEQSLTTSMPLIRPTFSLGLGIVSILYVLACRCRYPFLRRKALHLLQICNRREGMWDSATVAHIVARIMSIEETGALMWMEFQGKGPLELSRASDIPEWARVRDVVPVFGVGRSARLKYLRFKAGTGMNGIPPEMEEFEEAITW